jgi:hypothetical protein
MVSKKMFHSIDELQKVQLLATQCIDEVGLQSSDGSVSVDAKSFIGMYALDFTQPIWVCCDDPSFHKKIRKCGRIALRHFRLQYSYTTLLCISLFFLKKSRKNALHPNMQGVCAFCVRGYLRRPLRSWLRAMPRIWRAYGH